MEMNGHGGRLWRDCKKKVQAIVMKVNNKGMKAGWAGVEERNQNVGRQG